MMSPRKSSAGKYRGFVDKFTWRETSCFPAQIRNRTAAPASKAKMDHSSTAPKANTANIKRTHIVSDHCGVDYGPNSADRQSCAKTEDCLMGHAHVRSKCKHGSEVHNG